jgi:hypothetical protein
VEEPVKLGFDTSTTRPKSPIHAVRETVSPYRSATILPKLPRSDSGLQFTKPDVFRGSVVSTSRRNSSPAVPLLLTRNPSLDPEDVWTEPTIGNILGT